MIPAGKQIAVSCRNFYKNHFVRIDIRRLLRFSKLIGMI